jgi:lipopolysaccharide transport system ATP-binding protein
MNCSILGLSKEEIDARFEDIVSFADIGDFLDQPVKTYSSGMFVRLAFSVNIMSDPEIMVVDEALSVGDMAFQAKCMTALREIQNHGATILFVSHDVGSVKSLCTNAAHLVNGQLKKFGKASDVAEDYVRLVREEMNTQDQKHFKQTPCLSSKQSNALIKVKNNSTFKTSAEFDRRAKQFRYGAGGATIRYAELLDMYDTPVVSAEFNQEVKIKIYFDVQRDIDLSANYYINDDKKNLILGAGFITAGFPLLHCTKDTQYIVTYTTTLPLREGNYSVQLQLTRPIVIDQTAESLDVINDAIVFNVQRKPNGRIWASVYLDNSVEVESI